MNSNRMAKSIHSRLVFVLKAESNKDLHVAAQADTNLLLDAEA